MSKVTKQTITEAVARGWTHPKNAQKVMDTDLAFAIVDEVLEALSNESIENRHVAKEKSDG